MRLYLVRHGEASHTIPGSPLTERGTEEIVRLAAFLAGSDQVRPEVIYHSAKMRARQTAELIAVALGGELMAEETTGLAPMDSVAQMSDRIRDDERDVMLVGHLPFMNRLGSLLVAGSAGAQAFDISTGGMLALVRHAGSPTDSAWSLSFMVTPGVLPDAPSPGNRVT